AGACHSGCSGTSSISEVAGSAGGAGGRGCSDGYFNGQERFGRNEYGGRREQMRPAATDLCREAEQARLGLELLAQALRVEASAVATVVDRSGQVERTNLPGEAEIG
uniref:hypothetical protein n=1 Tax=Thauera sp. AutoDN2 TaxID=3416051 RepID=UPI003F4B7248